MNEIERFLVSKAVYSENSLLTDKHFQLVAFKIMSLILLFHHVHFVVHMYKCTKNQFIDIEMIFFSKQTEKFRSLVVYMLTLK